MNTNLDVYTIAFYNIQNLFDITNNSRTNDNDFLPNSAKQCILKRYQNQLMKLAIVIS